jgi:hypothetical protein
LISDRQVFHMTAPKDNPNCRRRVRIRRQKIIRNDKSSPLQQSPNDRPRHKLPSNSPVAAHAGRPNITRESNMDVAFQDAGRDRREQERQRLFRDKFIAETPPWYHGAIHLGFTLLVTGAAMWLCWRHIQNAGWEWLLVIPIALFGNWIEWAAHRYILPPPGEGAGDDLQAPLHGASPVLHPS